MSVVRSRRTAASFVAVDWVHISVFEGGVDSVLDSSTTFMATPRTCSSLRVVRTKAALSFDFNVLAVGGGVSIIVAVDGRRSNGVGRCKLDEPSFLISTTGRVSGLSVLLGFTIVTGLWFFESEWVKGKGEVEIWSV